MSLTFNALQMLNSTKQEMTSVVKCKGLDFVIAGKAVIVGKTAAVVVMIVW